MLFHTFSISVLTNRFTLLFSYLLLYNKLCQILAVINNEIYFLKISESQESFVQLGGSCSEVTHDIVIKMLVRIEDIWQLRWDWRIWFTDGPWTEIAVVRGSRFLIGYLWEASVSLYEDLSAGMPECSRDWLPSE